MNKKEFIEHLNFISAELEREDNEVMKAYIEEYFEDYKTRLLKGGLNEKNTGI